MRLRNIILFMGLILGTARWGTAQDIQTNLSEVASTYGRLYIQPAVNAFGGSLNTGLFHPTTVGDHLFHPRIYFGVRGAGTIMPIRDLFFSTVYQDQFELEMTRDDGSTVRAVVPATFEVEEAPTLFGTYDPGRLRITIQETVEIFDNGELEVYQIDTTITRDTFGGIYTTDVGPSAIPQLELGTIFGTDVMIRWLPKVSIRDIGSIQWSGYGIRHNLRPHFKLPFDLTLQAAVQKANIRDDNRTPFATARTRAANITISKSTGVWRVFATFQQERTEVDVHYTYEPGDLIGETDLAGEITLVPIDINLNLKSNIDRRLTLGFNLILGPLNLTGGYSLGRWDVLSAGVGIMLGGQ